MRLLVHEFVTGGGLAGRPVPEALVPEGRAMVSALVSDLAATGRFDVAVTLDVRFPMDGPPSVRRVRLDPDGVADCLPARTRGLGSPEDRLAQRLGELGRDAEAVWIIAPETGGCLERVTRALERRGRPVVGSTADAIAEVSDKGRLAARLRSLGLPHPHTCVVSRDDEVGAAARLVGYPLVVKPVRGAGCCGVGLVQGPAQLQDAVTVAGREGGGDPQVLVQRYVAGEPASVTLLVGDARAHVVAVNGQTIREDASWSYQGGVTPLAHPAGCRAASVCRRLVGAIPGLRGFVGVDVVLEGEDAWIIEVNARLTTAYLGLRASVPGGLAADVVDAWRGRLAGAPVATIPIRYGVDGTVARVATTSDALAKDLGTT